MQLDQIREWMTLAVLGFPAATFFLLGGLALFFRSPSEKTTARLTAFTFVSSFLLAVASFVLVFTNGPLDFQGGSLFQVPGYSFEFELLVDRLSGTMMVLTTTILGLVGFFSGTYLHREPGFDRFFILLSLFATGMLLIVMAGNIDLLFAGWELVGLTSVLLIGFYQDRDAPVRRGLAALVTYRVCDVGLLLGAMLLHHYAHTAALGMAFTTTTWPIGVGHLGSGAATTVALLFVIGAIGKGAQLPASGWLPRAMEGPTPSSALFYGALSVHAAVYLLIRMAPVFAEAPIARGVLIVVGLSTAIYGTLTGRVQSDVKNTLAYATMCQVGIMFVEVGLGLHGLAVIHLVGHAFVRTLQLLRAPSALREMNAMHAAFGGIPQKTGAHIEAIFPEKLRAALYRHALDGFHLDAFVQRVVPKPVMWLATRVDAFGRWFHATMIGMDTTATQRPIDEKPEQDPNSTPRPGSGFGAQGAAGDPKPQMSNPGTR